MSLETNLQSIIGGLVLQLAQAQTANQDLSTELAALKAQPQDSKTALKAVPPKVNG